MDKLLDINGWIPFHILARLPFISIMTAFHIHKRLPYVLRSPDNYLQISFLVDLPDEFMCIYSLHKSEYIFYLQDSSLINKANWNENMVFLNKGQMGQLLQSGSALIMGDREKGEETEACNNFSHALLQTTWRPIMLPADFPIVLQ